MQLILEKLSRHWQLRFLAIGAGLLLIVYAVLMPDPGNKSGNAAIESVAAAANAESAPVVVDSGSVGLVSGDPATLPAPAAVAVRGSWLGQDRALTDQLNVAANGIADAPLPRDFSESVRGLRRAADGGDATAEFLLGHAYETGQGVPKDMTETARWYGLAAQSRSADEANGGSSPAPANFGQAFDRYRQAAEQGDMGAELYLGLAYDLGQDVPRNSTTAARWYRKAAAQGSYSSASNLGVLYYNGDGLPKDSVEAAVWFRNAAARGSASAQYSLGRLYFLGDGVPRNAAEAAGWLEKAADRGNAQAQVLLSLMYATGQGVAGSAAQAYKWINLASASEEQARTSREQIEKILPASEVAEGQKLTHDWLEQHGSAVR